MQFSCHAFGASTCWTGGTCAANGSCIQCAPGWQHQRGVVVNEDCMLFSAFLPVMIAVATTVAVFSLSLVLHNLVRLVRAPDVSDKQRSEVKIVGGLILVLVMSSWLMSLFIYISAPVVYPWTVTGQVLSSFFVFHILKRKLLGPAFNMYPHIGRKVRRIDVGLLGASILIMTVNAALASIGASVGRMDLYNLGETMQIVTMSLAAGISLALLRWLSRRVQQEIDSTHAEGVLTMTSEMQRARARFDKIRRVSFPITALCLVSIMLCAISFKMGTIPFVDMWICMGNMSTSVLFTIWFRVIFRPRVAASHGSSSSREARVGSKDQLVSPGPTQVPTPVRLSPQSSPAAAHGKKTPREGSRA